MNNPAARSGYVFFDADDTLWENEIYYREAERRFALLFSSILSEEEAIEVITRKQEEVIPAFGYGFKTFLVAMTDAAIEICGGQTDKKTFNAIKNIVTDLSRHEVVMIDGVEEVFRELSRKYRIVIATKGDLMEQLFKCRNSGLGQYVFQTEVLFNKDEENYLALSEKIGIAPEDMLMVGNSVKSDIVPVLNIGGSAIHIPHEMVWAHEMMDLPQSDRLIELENIREIRKILL